MIRLPMTTRTASLSALLLGLTFHLATAAPLAPAAYILNPPFESDPVDATMLDIVTSPFASVDIRGQVISQVYSGDDSNPFGVSGLTFTYRIIMDALSPHAVSGFSVGNYGGFGTDVSYNNLVAAGISPFMANRSAGLGDVVRFTFFPGIAHGEASALLVVQTDSRTYERTLASVINSGSAVVASFAPSEVPEPAMAALAILGGLAILGLRWQRPQA